MGMINTWISNLKYLKVRETSSSDWLSYMETHTSPMGGALKCLNSGLFSGLFKSRSFLIFCLLLNVVPLYMLSSTHTIFTPETDWRCVVESHTGVTPICQDYMEKKPDTKNAVCSMELGIDFAWNFTFTSSPILEYHAFCPLQRIVEPRLVNFLGSFCGSLVGGIFIDTLGRKNMSMISVFFSLLTTLSYKVSSNMIMYTYQEFIKGIFSSVAAMSLLTWCIELSNPEYSSPVVAAFFICSSLGGVVTTGITYISHQWRVVVVLISGVGFGLLPLVFLIPSSLRYMVARGKTKSLPKSINFRRGVIMGSRAKDCLSRPQTNRLYGINAVTLILLGFSSSLLCDVMKLQHRGYDAFVRTVMVQVVFVIGHVVALFVSLLPMFMYVINVFMVLIGGILAIVATSTNYTDSVWSLARVLTGTGLMLVSLSVALTFTTIKQIPTLNRGFYASGINASYMLGSLIYVILHSWCLEKEHEEAPFCSSSSSEDLRLLTAGIILLLSVAPAFINTCLTRNINLPHSYAELRRFGEEAVVEEAGVEMEKVNGEAL